MTREQFAQLIHWSWIIWAFGIVNVWAMVPQLRRLLRTHETKGLEPKMFWIYFSVQVALSLEGFFRRNTMLMCCLGLSAGVSMWIIVLIYRYRRAARMEWLQQMANTLYVNMIEHCHPDLEFTDYHGFQKAPMPGNFKDSVLRNSGYSDFDVRAIQVEIVKVDRPLVDQVHYHRKSDAIAIVLGPDTRFAGPCHAMAYFAKDRQWLPVEAGETIKIPRRKRHGFSVMPGGLMYFLSVQSPRISSHLHDDYVRVR